MLCIKKTIKPFNNKYLTQFFREILDHPSYIKHESKCFEKEKLSFSPDMLKNEKIVCDVSSTFSFKVIVFIVLFRPISVLLKGAV